MKQAFKKYFIPHAENNYHPHILHTKRAVFYSALFLVMKLIVFVFAISLPAAAFVAPDIMAIEQEKIIAMVNDLRAGQNKNVLTVNTKLNVSSAMKANDMAQGSYFSHTSPAGNNLAYFLKQAGYNYSVAGENLAMGFNDTAELFQAWVDSPTHYNNIVDTDFKETGIGVMAGLYNDIPTIYIAEHFGTPKVVAQTAPKEEIVAPAVTVPEPKVESDTKIEPVAVVEPKEEVLPTEQAEVASEKETAPTETEVEAPVVALAETFAPVVYNAENSSLIWQETGKGMLITASADIIGDVGFAEVEVRQYRIPLQKQGDKYVGSIEIKEDAHDFFKVILPGVISIAGLDDTGIEASIPWQEVLIVKPTSIEKYSLAKSRLSAVTGIFELSKNIYFAFLIFFAIALGLKIFIEIRKQHYHIIAQTCGLMAILVLMILC
jgi:hypothetical protein